MKLTEIDYKIFKDMIEELRWKHGELSENQLMNRYKKFNNLGSEFIPMMIDFVRYEKAKWLRNFMLDIISDIFEEMKEQCEGSDEN